MRILEKYNGTKTYMFPNGDIATPEKIEQQFPAINTFTHVIETDEAGKVCFTVMNLAELKSQNKIDLELDEENAIQALQDKFNEQPIYELSAEERIAAAIEFQNAVMLQEKRLSIEPSIAIKNYKRGLWSADQVESTIDTERLNIDLKNIKREFILESKEEDEFIGKS